MLNLTFSTQTDMLDPTFSTLFHIWVLSVEIIEFDTRNVNSIRTGLKAILQFLVSLLLPNQWDLSRVLYPALFENKLF